MVLLKTATTLLAATAAYAWNHTASDVIATGTMGTTNPPEATMGTDLNQTSVARLVSINSIDDFCFFGPKEANVTIGDTEDEQVAWCTKPRNNARVIPDGTITSAHFVKTPAYVQVSGFGDLTKIGVKDADYGGELDPHGATGDGNPVGGNVTSDIVNGTSISYAEWMEFISYEQFCIRICTASNDTWGAPVMCEHKLDEMGCSFVMPDAGDSDVFETCDADVAYPPGVYPIDGSYSTFAQRYTGSYSSGTTGAMVGYTVGVTDTPTAAQMTPSSSNCVTQSSFAGNNVDVSATGVIEDNRDDDSDSNSDPDSNESDKSNPDGNGGGSEPTDNGQTSANAGDGDSSATTFTGFATVSAIALAVLAIAL
ncbi:hypothetical protein E3P96_02434 [Wallemia ichthyophaga]|nr:hypothetical protein E3P96_02434 [Wallemia ichthyophaga]